jgi:predicted small lipoprotein YifL
MAQPVTIKTTVITFLLLNALGGITACGNKGPLYIPQPPVEQQGSASEDNASEED